MEEKKVEERTPHAKNLFMAADSTMITVGGGYGLVSINGIAAFTSFHHVSNLHVSRGPRHDDFFQGPLYILVSLNV